MAKAALLPLLLCLALSEPHMCLKCEENCYSRYENQSLLNACIDGCRLPMNRDFRTDERNVHLDCEEECNKREDTGLKASCYVGCSHIEPSELTRPDKGVMSTLRSVFKRVMSSLFSFFRPSEPRPQEPRFIQTANVKVLLPKEVRVIGPLNTMDDEMRIMRVKMMHAALDEAPGAMQMMLPPENEEGVKVPTIPQNFCYRARVALHYVTTHPLFLASIILMFIASIVLLVFACIRLGARRARRAAFQRQYQRLPAFFEPASVKVSLTKPQSPFDGVWDSELPPKTPLV